MRPDMQHLLVERGHAGTGYTRYQPKGWSARCRFRTEGDDQRESFISPRRRPQFSENLAPLRRYLAAQVGRPWAKVYSEIRSQVDADSAVQYHILQHLYDCLAVKVLREADGALWYHRAWGGLRPLRGSHMQQYVCPDTGLIRLVKRRHRAPTVPVSRDSLPADGPDHEFRDLAGQWYEVWWGMVNQHGTLMRTIVRKRQLGHKELRTLGLRY